VQAACLWRSGGSASGARPGTGLPHRFLVGGGRAAGVRPEQAGCVCVLSRRCAMTVGFMSCCSLAERSSMSTTIPTSTAGSMGSSTSSPPIAIPVSRSVLNLQTREIEFWTFRLLPPILYIANLQFITTTIGTIGNKYLIRMI
jgi:hypothetical protein